MRLSTRNLRVYELVNLVSLKLYCNDDNTATEAQKVEIDRFLNSIDGNPVPQTYELRLPGDVQLRVEVQSGQGRVYMFRDISSAL